MSKSLIGILYLIGVIGVVVGIVLLIQSSYGGTITVNALGGRTDSPGNSFLFIVGLVITVLAAIPLVVAWIAALIRVALLKHWNWFICLFVLSVIAIPVYLFAGIETPAPRARQSGL